MNQKALAELRASIGDELLGKLLGRSATSLRAYASGRRVVPPSVATRAAWLERIAVDLAGGYDSGGARAWFGRARAELGHRSPLQVLGRDWQPLDEVAVQVERLAATLRGPV